jgi:hypothetical protein
MLPITTQNKALLREKLLTIRNPYVIRAIRRKALEQIEAKNNPEPKK